MSSGEKGRSRNVNYYYDYYYVEKPGETDFVEKPKSMGKVAAPKW